MASFANDTHFPTKSPGGNVTEVVYISHQDVTELTIIVWTVGGVLLITLLSLLGRIILARRKDPSDQMGYQRHRGNVFRIRIDSEYFAPDTGTGFSVPRDTTELVTRTATESPAESPTPPRNHPSGSTSCGDAGHSVCRQMPRNTIQNTVSHNTGANNAACNSGTLHNTQINTNNLGARETMSSVSIADVGIFTSHTLPTMVTTGNSNSVQQDNSESNQITPNSVLSSATSRQLSGNKITGSHAVLSNGVVISPPPYHDVITTSARLPSLIISGPSRPKPRRILFSL